MKFLILDDNARSRQKLAELLGQRWPDVQFDEWDPLISGLPRPDMDWQQYSLLLLDYDMKVGNGLDWYEQNRALSDFPRTIVLSTVADPEIAVRAIKVGADNYLPKRGLDARKLNEIVEEIVAHPNAHRAPVGNMPSGQEEGDPSRVMRLQKPNPRRHWPQIQGHTILEKIGQGGMSSIFLANRESDAMQVVVKVLLMGMAENKKTLLRSHQEFKLISRIQNPHIVRLYEHATVDDLLYTTMEYFSKGDLKLRLRKGMLQHHALRYLRQIAEGLSAIHGCGVIHRDLKPGNIMFRDDDSLAIIDFGISKDINAQLDLTEDGQIMGTPNYMAPEQGKGLYKPDARSDLYSLGVLLYEMLTGNKPYAAPTGAAIMYKHLHDPIPKLPNRFYDMQVLIDKLMAKFPQERIQSAYELIHFLDDEFRLDMQPLDFE
jgi:DNA-binding NarL/FixJ family response regulator